MNKITSKFCIDPANNEKENDTITKDSEMYENETK